MPTVAPDYLERTTYAPLFFDSLAMGKFQVDPAGYSMVGGQVTVNSIERLKHIFDVAYIWDMLDERKVDGVMFDGFGEVALVNEYQVAEGTTLSMLAGAIIPDAVSGKYEEDVAYAINFKLQYDF
jgi:hypothetical protein